jgi:hypothetical protein
MNALQRICSLLLVGLFALPFFSPVIATASGEEPETYAQDDQHALVLPGVVRIIYHLKGTFYVDPFSINLRTLEVTSRPGRAKEESIDTQMSGTGFSLSEGGLFATNAHVVTPEHGRLIQLRQAMFDEVVRDGMDIMMRFGPSSRQMREWQEAAEALEDIDEDDPRLLTMIDALMSYSRFVDKGSSVYVVPQGATSTSFKRLVESGYKVDEVVAPDRWVINDRDVALLRITDATLMTVPALALASGVMEGINTPVSAYGFPGSTDLSADSLTSVTVTQGRVTSLKTVSKEKFDIYQIDAKISSGSSGGPMVDQQGRVLGLITATTVHGEGDKFGFAVPVHILTDLLEAQGVTELHTEYQRVLRNAYFLKEDRRCKLANEAFLEAISLLGASSGVGTAPLQEHIDACDQLIAAGLSIDSRFDSFKERLRSISVLTWSIIGAGFVLLIGALFVGLLLMRELTKSRAEVKNLENDRDILIGDGFGHPLVDKQVEPNMYPLQSPPPPPTPDNALATETTDSDDASWIEIFPESVEPVIPVTPAPKPSVPTPPVPKAPPAPPKPASQHKYNAEEGDDVFEQGDVVAVISHRPTYGPPGGGRE